MVVLDESKWDERDVEVDQIMWLPPAEVIKLLNHKEQRELIENLQKPKIDIKGHKWIRLSKSARYDRLSGSLLAYRTELEHKKDIGKISNQDLPAWFVSATKLLSDSERSLNSGDIDRAWKCFHAAQRMEIYSLNITQLNIKAGLLRSESKKLSFWRKDATAALLKLNEFLDTSEPNAKVRETDSRYERVYQAALIRDESFNNQAHKDRIVKEHIRFLAISTLLVGLILLLFRLLNQELKEIIPQHTLILLHCPLFGMAGAILSSAHRVKSTSQSSRIPEIINTRTLTTLRIFIGGMSAFILCIFVKSQFVTSFFTLNDQEMIPYIYSLYFIAFIAGFSERLVLKAIDSVSKDKSEDKPNLGGAEPQN